MNWFKSLLSKLLHVEEPKRQEPVHDEMRGALALIKSLGRGYLINTIDFHAESSVALLYGDYESMKRALERMSRLIGDMTIRIEGVDLRAVIRTALKQEL